MTQLILEMLQATNIPFALPPTNRADAPSIDGKHVLMGNFFDGDVAKFGLETGEIVSRGNIGKEASLSGLAQFPG